MCGAFGYTKERGKAHFEKRFMLERFPEHNWHSYNIRPTQESYVIVRKSPNRAVKFVFGIPAPWDEKHFLINAQSETVSEKRSFAKMFRESRCLIIADVFYEWKRLPDGKQPYAFSLKNGETFSFAGIHNDEGFIILTTKPNTLMEDVHNRMPVILHRDDEDVWLNPDTEVEHLQKTLRPYPAQEMKRWAISSLVSKSSNNFPEILKPMREG